MQETSITWQSFLNKCLENPNWSSEENLDPRKHKVIIFGENAGINSYTPQNKEGLLVLGPALHFAGKGVVCFNDCTRLDRVQAHFHIPVAFQRCGLTSVRGIKIHAGPEFIEDKPRTRFTNCKHLALAEGTWPGGVSFNGSGITRVTPDFLSQGPTEMRSCPELQSIEGTIEGFLLASACPKLKTTNNLKVLGTNSGGTCADFSKNPLLKRAEGFFQGFVDWSGSGVVEIGEDEPGGLELHPPLPEKPLKEGTVNLISGPGWAASFALCSGLKKVSRTFHGTVDFSQSGLESTKGLKITAPNLEGVAAVFSGCKSLGAIEGEFPGTADYRDSAVAYVGALKLPHEPKKNFLILRDCPNLDFLPQHVAALGEKAIWADPILWDNTQKRTRLREAISRTRSKKGEELGLSI
jgi:hypothetical protein